MAAMHRLRHLVLRPLPSRQLVLCTSTRSTSSSLPFTNRKRRHQSQPNVKLDWREKFRSIEYDDAWSSYVQFAVDSHPDKIDDPSSQSQVRALIKGQWRKRRHGMNLVPLDMQLKQEHSSAINQKNKKPLHQDPEIQQATEQYEGRLRWLDSQSRFLCSMLDDLYRTGIRRQIDRSRTERCHRIIGKLLTLTPSPSSENFDKLPFKITGLAPRAAAILNGMEKCSPVTLKHNIKPDKIEADKSKTSNGSGGVRSPQHLPYTKHALPYPTTKIYNMVLLLFTKESGPIYVAQQSEDVLWSMIERYMQQTELREYPSEQSILPSKENWECVLKCWSNSTDPDRAIHARIFLESWIEWGEYVKSQINAATDVPMPDIDSYHILLASCYTDAANEDGRAVEIGSKVALQTWDEIKKSAMNKNSETYRLILRSICQTLDIASNTSKQSIILAKKIFQICCNDGLLTIGIVNIVRQTLPDNQLGHLLGINDTLFESLTTEEIMKKVPDDWYANAVKMDASI